MRRWAQLLEDEDLSDPTSSTATPLEPAFAYPTPFLGATVVKLHSLGSNGAIRIGKILQLFI